VLDIHEYYLRSSLGRFLHCTTFDDANVTEEVYRGVRNEDEIIKYKIMRDRWKNQGILNFEKKWDYLKNKGLPVFFRD
jgi:hypothetical protein